MAFHWSDDGKSEKGVTERGFAAEAGDRSAPGIAWLPEHGRADSLVLIGHGGNGYKREPHILSLARRLVRHHGIAAAAIDGPAHGERRPQGAEGEDLEAVRRRVLTSETTDAMIEDWKAALDGLAGELSGAVRVGYWGLSMGTIFGLPLVAAEPRISVAVLGLMGTRIPTGERLVRDAAGVRCPVLFLQQWHDELIPRESCAELFGAIASEDKRLHANPGAHSAVPRDEFLQTQAFLADRLVPSD